MTSISRLAPAFKSMRPVEVASNSPPAVLVISAAVAVKATLPVVAIAATPSFPVRVMVPPPSASVSVASIVIASFVALMSVVFVPVRIKSRVVKEKSSLIVSTMSSLASIRISSSAPTYTSFPSAVEASAVSPARTTTAPPSAFANTVMAFASASVAEMFTEDPVEVISMSSPAEAPVAAISMPPAVASR